MDWSRLGAPDAGPDLARPAPSPDADGVELELRGPAPCQEAFDQCPVTRAPRRVTMGSVIGGTPGLYATVYRVARQGNALLLAFESGEGGGSEEAIGREQREALRSLTDVVEAMCDYRADGC